MTSSEICNKAHATADRLLAVMPRVTDFDGVARTACWLDGLDPDGRDGQLYQDRMIGHMINVQAGTVGV